MKFFLVFALLCSALTACEPSTVTHPASAQKCHDELGLAYGTAEYTDCVDKFSAQEGAIRSSKHLH